MRPISQADFEDAKSIVYETMQPTLQHPWPLLCAQTGCEVWVKHENHTPTGAFKIRGGLVHMRQRKRAGKFNGVITASTGNHGQSIPFAAGREGIKATVVVPQNNSREKNAAMKALGAELIEVGHDFTSAKKFADELAAERGLDMIASFHRDLVLGVSTYAHELFAAAGELDVVYVPIGLGSGICGVISARDLLGLKTKVVGVVSENANAYALSFQENKPISVNRADTFAEGIAVREPNSDAVEIINKGAQRIVEVADEEIRNAMRLIYRATHNVAEGAGAAALAALLKERELNSGKRVGVILSGGNIDTDKYVDVLTG